MGRAPASAGAQPAKAEAKPIAATGDVFPELTLCGLIKAIARSVSGAPGFEGK
jgi:hypothetical protein